MPRLERAQRGIGWHGLLLAAGATDTPIERRRAIMKA